MARKKGTGAKKTAGRKAAPRKAAAKGKAAAPKRVPPAAVDLGPRTVDSIHAADVKSKTAIARLKRDIRKRGKRWFAHPQGDVLQHGNLTYIPGEQVDPNDLPATVAKMWADESFIVSEMVFKLHFPEEWNRGHPTEKIAIPEALRTPDEVEDVSDPESVSELRTGVV